MNTKQILTIALCLFMTASVDAQIFKKLKKRAEKAAERTILKKTDQKVSETTENAIDSITKGDDGNSKSNKEAPEITESVNPALSINTDLKRQFYTSDIIVKMYQEGEPSQTFYFDADELAARNEFHKEEKAPMFFDSEGYTYTYNTKNLRYEKSGFMKSGPMSMMVPMQLVEAYKLPSQPFYETVEEFNYKGLRLNSFNVVEFAFIYKPEHFETEDYSRSSATCGASTCTKFSNNIDGYEGSYVLFDAVDRLMEIHINIDNEQGKGNGKLEYEYKNSDVKIPPSVEVKMPGEDLFNMGLDPNKN